MLKRSLTPCKKLSRSSTAPCSWTSDAAWISDKHRPCIYSAKTKLVSLSHNCREAWTVTMYMTIPHGFLWRRGNPGVRIQLLLAERMLQACFSFLADMLISRTGVSQAD